MVEEAKVVFQERFCVKVGCLSICYAPKRGYVSIEDETGCRLETVSSERFFAAASALADVKKQYEPEG